MARNGLPAALLALGTAATCAGAGVALPLHTSGRYLVDAAKQRVKLAAVNWYGAEEQDYVVAGLEYAPLSDIARQIRVMGFNAVRLPWSNEMVETNPVIANARLAANPSLAGLPALGVFDAVVAALANEGLQIVLDNHMSNANWCCSDTDGNGLWYNAQFPESNWLADWQTMAGRYLNQPAVIGADLRNEPRDGATWGGSDPQFDWHAAAERGGNAVLAANPNLLIFVEGINYATDLTGALGLPVQLSAAGQVVYSSHDYSWDHTGLSSYDELAAQLDGSWGYLLASGVPVWVGEFGTCHTDVSCVTSSSAGTGGFWFSNFQQYLQQRDADWSYWALNGTEARGDTRTLGAEETYGILNVTWTGSASPDLLNALQAVSAPTAAPAVNPGGIVDPVTYAAQVAPGSLASVFGTALAPVTSPAASLPLLPELGGGAVSMNGSVSVPLLFASPDQMNIQIPWELDPAAPASLTVSVGWLSSAEEPVTLAMAAPVVFLMQPGVSNQGAVLIANTNLIAAPAGSGFPNAQPAHPGDYISIFCTGLGAVTNRPATGAAAPSNPLAWTVAMPT
ncbi:MAG: cellulase family glycosylhydrolase, partial [Bryobacteraceae bacterium]